MKACPATPGMAQHIALHDAEFLEQAGYRAVGDDKALSLQTLAVNRHRAVGKLDFCASLIRTRSLRAFRRDRPRRGIAAGNCATLHDWLRGWRLRGPIGRGRLRSPFCCYPARSLAGWRQIARRRNW